MNGILRFLNRFDATRWIVNACVWTVEDPCNTDEEGLRDAA